MTTKAKKAHPNLLIFEETSTRPVMCAAILEECKFHRDLFEDDAA